MRTRWPSGFHRMDLRARFITWTLKSAAQTRCRSRISPPARATPSAQPDKSATCLTWSLRRAGIPLPPARPEHLGVGVVEYLAQVVRPDQHAAVARHGQRLIAHAQAARAFQHEIKLLRAGALVQRVRAS